MQRIKTFATVGLFLAAIPSVTSGQAPLDELLRAHGKTVAEHEFAAAIEVERPQAKAQKDNRVLARSYADYAYAIQKQGRHAEAVPILKWVLIAREAELEPDSPVIAQTLNQLAALYFEIGKYAEAETLLKRATESQTKAAKPSANEFARSQTMLGLLMTAQHRYDEAVVPFRLAITLRENSRGPSSPDTGDALTNLAWVYHQQGKNREARPLFERALKIFEEKRGSIDPSVAHTLHGLGKIQFAEAEVEDAEARYLKAIAIWDALPVLDDRALVEVLKDYAALLEKLGRAEDLVKIKARLTPLQAKLTANEPRLDPRFRWPEASMGATGDFGTPRRRG
jgi:tetratricopeptide (TPR) repeat protein